MEMFCILAYINISILVVILHYSFVKCYHILQNVTIVLQNDTKGYTRYLYVIYYSYMSIYNYLKTKCLTKRKKKRQGGREEGRESGISDEDMRNQPAKLLLHCPLMVGQRHFVNMKIFPEWKGL